MVARKDLRGRLLDMLNEGGARKLTILRAWAQRAGLEPVAFKAMVAGLRRAGLVRGFQRHGGTHLELTKLGRARLLLVMPTFTPAVLARIRAAVEGAVKASRKRRLARRRRELIGARP